MVATIVLAECEKNIQNKLEKLKEFQSSLENALNAIKRVQELEFGFQGSPDEIVKKILEESIKNLPEQLSHGETNAPSHSENVNNDDERQSEIREEAEEIYEEKKEKTNALPNTPKPAVDNVDDTEKFIQNLVCSSGAKAGVKYKIEVTSPLAVDGTFWASNVETGFVTDKLEPLSEKLKNATQLDRSLWVVDDTSKLVCVKSSHNSLWMRAKVIKENNPASVRVQFVDLGRTEDCTKSRLSKLPPKYEAIPYMAFHCTLSEERINVQYEIKWKFSDLVKKKVLNFTVQKLIPHGDEKLVFGKLETILDSPPIIVNEQIIPGCLMMMQAERENKDVSTNIASRDIRVQNSDLGKELTSVSEIIRNNSVSKEDVLVTKEESLLPPSGNEVPQKSSRKVPPPLSPIEIPEQTDDMGWGDSKTPSADEHMKLSPLDDKLFESPTNSMGESQLKQELGRRQSASETQPNDTIGEQMNVELMLRQLLQQRDLLIQSVPSAEQSQMMQNIDQQLMSIYTQLNMLPPSFAPVSTEIQAINPQRLPQQQSNPSPQAFQPLLPIGTRPLNPAQNMPLLRAQLPMPLGSDFTARMQQLDAITRCLQAPNEALDNEHIRNLQMKRDRIQKQLWEENARKLQMEAIMKQQQQQQPQQPVQREYEQSQSMIPPVSASITGQLEKLSKMRQDLLTQSNDSIETGLSESVEDFLDEINKKTEEFRQNTISPLVREETATAVSRKREDSNSNSTNVSNDGSIEISHTSNFDATVKHKAFSVPTLEFIKSESKSSWTSRELLNLENSTLTDSKTKFYSTLIIEQRGKFLPNLEKTCTTGNLLLTESDAEIFEKEWKNANGPIFLISKYKLYDCTWMVGGILEVVSPPKVEKRTGYANYTSKMILSYQCKANVVSSAIVNDLPWFRSEKYSREIPREVALRYIQLIVSKLQEGTCKTLFRFQDQRIKQQAQQPYFYNHQQQSNTTSNQQSTTTKSNQQQQESATSSPIQQPFKVPPSSSYFSETPVSSANLGKSTRPMNVVIPQSEENWDLELNSSTRAPNKEKNSASGEDLGSGDEGERDFNAEIEAFGLSKEDL